MVLAASRCRRSNKFLKKGDRAARIALWQRNSWRRCVVAVVVDDEFDEVDDRDESL